MTSLDSLAGTAQGGTLYGIGVGPGDVRYLTLRAAGLVRAVDVLAFFAKRGLEGNARRIVAALLLAGRAELRCEYPVTDEVPAEHPDYQEKISRQQRNSRPSCAKASRSDFWPKAIPSSTDRSCICGVASRASSRSRSCRA